MDEDFEKRKRRRKLRRILLNKIINSLFNNKDNSDLYLSNPLGGARREYYSPTERNTSNYGYAEQHEVNKG